MLFSCEDFHGASFVSCSTSAWQAVMSLVPIFPLKGEQISEALVLRRSEAGRFAYNLRVPGSPIRPHADTPTRSFVVAAPPFTVRRFAVHNPQSAIRNSFTVRRSPFGVHRSL